MADANNKWTEIVSILDRSGSMTDIKDEVIAGYNTFIEEQRAETGRARVTLVLFDNAIKTPYANADIASVEMLTSSVYYPGGSTALLDAVGRTIEGTRASIEAMHPDERPDDVVVLIMTDGLENASVEYDRRTVSRMIETRQGEGWEFVFIGANIDAARVSSDLKIDAGSAHRATKDPGSTRDSYRRMSRAVSNIRNDREKGDVAAPLDDE